MTAQTSKKGLYWFFSLWVIGQIVWDIFLYTEPTHTTWANYWLNIYYGSTSLIIGIVGLVAVYKNARHGPVGSALTYLLIGSLCNGVGLWIWGYYNIFTNIEIPYPSPAEAFFLTFPLLLTAGTIMLLRFFANKINWRVVVEAIVVTLISSVPIFHYFILPNLSPDLPAITRFITIAIPLEDALLIGLVYMVLRIGGGKVRSYWFWYVIAYLFLIAGDFVFQYRAAVGIYWNGDIADLLYILNAFFFSIAIIKTIDSYYESSELSLIANVDENPFSSPSAGASTAGRDPVSN